MKMPNKEEWIISAVVMTCVFSIVFFIYCSWILFSLNRTIPEIERDMTEIRSETEHIKQVEEHNVEVNRQILETLQESGQ